MNAKSVIENLKNTMLPFSDLKWCFCDVNKIPLQVNGQFARTNTMTDFVDWQELEAADDLESYAGVGISIQASNICAIDVDHCFSVPNDIGSIDERGKDILDMFCDIAYCEFSFSGTGLRILFRNNVIGNYTDNYYIKNEKNKVEFYQPSASYRYVTITGNTLFSNSLRMNSDLESTLYIFLNKYLLRAIPKKENLPIAAKIETKHEGKPLESLMIEVKRLYYKNSRFQNMWFKDAAGSGHDESESDFALLVFLYENITQDKEMVKSIFEASPYFASKDRKHRQKWDYQNNRYFEYTYNRIEKMHEN